MGVLPLFEAKRNGSGHFGRFLFDRFRFQFEIDVFVVFKVGVIFQIDRKVSHKIILSAVNIELSKNYDSGEKLATYFAQGVLVPTFDGNDALFRRIAF